MKNNTKDIYFYNIANCCNVQCCDNRNNIYYSYFYYNLIYLNCIILAHIACVKKCFLERKSTWKVDRNSNVIRLALPKDYFNKYKTIKEIKLSKEYKRFLKLIKLYKLIG